MFFRNFNRRIEFQINQMLKKVFNYIKTTSIVVNNELCNVFDRIITFKINALSSNIIT